MNMMPPCYIGCTQGGLYLANIYLVEFEGNTVGKAIVDTKGLYYHICCECKLPGKSIYRLHVISCGDTTDLGILIPEYDRYILNTTVAIKNFVGDKFSFAVYVPGDAREIKKTLIDPTQACEYLAQLEQARLIKRGNDWYITLEN